VYDKIAGLEAQIENMTPLPRINVARASIYPLSGETIELLSLTDEDLEGLMVEIVDLFVDRNMFLQ